MSAHLIIVKSDFIFPYLYHCHWKDSLTQVCVGRSEDMDTDRRHSTVPYCNCSLGKNYVGHANTNFKITLNW